MALSLEAFKGSTVPFDERLHARAPAAGRAAASPRACARCSTAATVVASHADCGRVQDPYTLRCAPQVLGAVDDALALHRGRARARARRGDRQPARLPRRRRRRGRRQLPRPAAVAAARPPRARAVRAGLASASGAPTRCSPPATPGCRAFLSPRPGLSSGLMIAQYAAAALVNECQVLAHPAGAGSIPTSAGPGGLQLDGRAARRSRRARWSRTAAQVVATELVCACQGLEFHRPLRTTPAARGRASAQVRALVPRLEEDRVARRRAGGAGRRAADRGGRAVRCRGWPQEAALRMLENNLHPDVAEQPAGPRRLRRDRQGRARPRVAATRSSASCSASAATRRCSCSRASRWPCSRPTPTRRAC